MNQINEICVALTQIPLDKMKDCCQQGQLHRLMAFLVRETPQDIQPIIQLLGSDIVEAYLLSLAKQPNQWVDLSLPEVVSTSVTSLELQQAILHLQKLGSEDIVLRMVPSLSQGHEIQRSNRLMSVRLSVTHSDSALTQTEVCSSGTLKKCHTLTHLLTQVSTYW